MDLARLNGIIQAIEGEQHNPQPSHQNLTRLTVMALVELRELLVLSQHRVEPTVTVTKCDAAAVVVEGKARKKTVRRKVK